MACNCNSSIDCTVVDQPVEANADVAGIGVLISFVATAVITFITIVIGYLSDSLPDTSLSQLDRACIAKFSTIRWRPWTKDSPISLLLRRSMTAAMGFLGWDSAVIDRDKGLENDEESRDARERRSQALLKFILALSDQQLVTGLAVLIAGFVSPCSMSIYHFYIIAAFGWLSSTTHLSTLALLRVYFVEHPKLRNWRVVAMLLVLALLVITQGATTATSLDNSVPVCCAFTAVSSEDLDFTSAISMITIIIILVASYIDRIVPLYSLDPQWSIQDWLVDGIVLASHKPTRLSKLTEIAIVCSKLPEVEQDKIRRKFKERQQYIGQELVKIAIESSNTTKAEQGVLWRSMNERRRYITYYDRLESRRSGWRRRFRFIVIMMTEMNYSFLGDLIMLLFGVVYGITQVIISRVEVPSAGIVGSQNDISFGQLVPLLLMLLPLFAAGEVYFGNNNKLYTWGLILIALSLERREDMLTKPSNDRIRFSNLTHGKPFFSRKVGLADIFRLFHSTQPSSDNTQHTVDTSSLLQSPGSVSSGIGGNNWIEIQSLPTSRLRRPDTETGQRAPMTGHSESARTPARNQWRDFTLAVACYTSFQIFFAICLGGVPALASLSAIISIGFMGVRVSIFVYSLYLGLKESRNPNRGRGA